MMQASQPDATADVVARELVGRLIHTVLESVGTCLTVQAGPTCLTELSSAVQQDVARFVDSIEMDTTGWGPDTRMDLAFEFNLSEEQATEMFRHLCKTEASRAFFAREDEARRAQDERERAVRDGDERRARRRPNDDNWHVDWPHAALVKNADEIGQDVLEKLDVRACPHCNANIEKNGGCPHMTCRACRRDFWWDDARPTAVVL